MNTESAGISPVTPAEVAPSTPAPTPASSAPPSTPPPASVTPAEQWTLEVNPRTKYNSRDEAIRGINELQTKYTQLAAWEKFYSPADKGGLGFTNLKDPEVVASLLDELMDLRTKAQASSGTPTPATQGGNQPAGAEQLTPEWQQYIKTLQEKGNFVTRDSLQKLESRLDEADSAREQVRTDQAVAHGTDLLREEMKTAGLGEDAKLLAKVGKRIGDSMNDEQAKAFVNGDVEFRRAFIKEALGEYLEFGTAFAASKNANYGSQKTSAIANTPRPLTPSGAPSPAPADAPKLGFRDPNLNKRVADRINAEAAALGG